MNILCVTHAEFETPGVIQQWASAKGHHFRIESPYKRDKLSPNGEFDLLILMGGPQSPVQIDRFPYLEEEVALVKEAIIHNKKVLGFCLGAQLIAEALEAHTERSPEKEVGVYPINLTPEGNDDPLLKKFPTSFPAIHWHYDMPGLTPASAVLATSRGCPRQVIRYTPHVYGFQCHLEITLDGIKGMIEAVPKDLHPSRFTQSKEELLAQDYASINSMMFAILDRLVEL